MDKSIHKNVRITQAQWEHTKSRCEMYGIKYSEYIRRLIDEDMGKTVSVQTQEEFLAKKQLAYEINRIGNNINQIVRNVNMHYYTEYEKKKLFAMMQKIMELCADERKEGNKR
ncbi:MAG: MobC family plasmid mobilization relaxosome protein [Roseburia sp.]|nr:MobC family plasmid mobilization relaxosome protein [Roseburia sp.]